MKFIISPEVQELGINVCMAIISDASIVNKNAVLEKIKRETVRVSEKTNNPGLLEAGFNVLSNNIFHQISDNVSKEVGLPVGERVFPAWQKWLMGEVRGRKT